MPVKSVYASLPPELNLLAWIPEYVLGHGEKLEFLIHIHHQEFV